MSLYDFKVEEELRKLCRWALMEEDTKVLRVVLGQIRQLVHENPHLLRSMPEETWRIMWDLRFRGLGRGPQDPFTYRNHL